MFRHCHDRYLHILAICLGASLPVMGGAQTLDLSITDPDEIAAQCGGDPNAGAPLFAAHCAECHRIEAVEGHGTGPNLHAVYGRVAGTAAGFEYSQALIEAGAGGMIWDRDSLHAYLSDPTGHLMGTSAAASDVLMDEGLRTDLMTYLRVSTTPPQPAPEDVTVPDAVMAMHGDIAYGEYLWSECAACHVAGAPGTGVSQIDTQMDRGGFVRAMFEYRANARPNPTMQIVANRLGDEEIAALAAYFDKVH